MHPGNLLAYEMNGEPLRFIALEWYGMANVKWLQRLKIRHRRQANIASAPGRLIGPAKSSRQWMIL